MDKRKTNVSTLKPIAPTTVVESESTPETTAGPRWNALVNRPLNYLSPIEEQVVRMRYGLIGGPDCRLERIGQENADSRAELAAIEARALARVCGLGDTDAAGEGAVSPKAKIIERLRSGRR